MQRTTRQGAARDTASPRNPSQTIKTITPSYPLLRMTLVAMVNLIVAYATLTWIPTKMIKHGDSDAAQGANISTLPSLSLTLVSLFLFQTLTGLVQAKLHSAYQTTAMNNSGKGRNQASLSLFAAFNTSVSIGAVGTLLCHVFAVLFGAGFVYQAMETSQLACYLSLLTFYPASFVLGTDLKSWLRIYIHTSPQTYTEAALYCQGMMAIFGAWLGSIVIPLDWDRPWQAWPVPCILGSFLFYCIGTVVGLVASIVMRHRAARSEFGIGADVKSNIKKVKSQ